MVEGYQRDTGGREDCTLQPSITIRWLTTQGYTPKTHRTNIVRVPRYVVRLCGYMKNKLKILW